jgi:hypothetical protein
MTLDPSARTAELAAAMQRVGLLEDPAPAAALRWIGLFWEAYGEAAASTDTALPIVAWLRAEAVTIPALELERLRSRNVLFFLDAVGQYDLPAIGEEFGLQASDAFAAVRMALTGETDGPPLELLFPLLGHERIMIRIGAVNSHILHGRGLEPIRYGPLGEPFRTIETERPTN